MGWVSQMSRADLPGLHGPHTTVELMADLLLARNHVSYYSKVIVSHVKKRKVGCDLEFATGAVLFTEVGWQCWETVDYVTFGDLLLEPVGQSTCLIPPGTKRPL